MALENDPPTRESTVKEDVRKRLLVVGGAATATETEWVLLVAAMALVVIGG